MKYKLAEILSTVKNTLDVEIIRDAKYNIEVPFSKWFANGEVNDFEREVYYAGLREAYRLAARLLEENDFSEMTFDEYAREIRILNKKEENAEKKRREISDKIREDTECIHQALQEASCEYHRREYNREMDELRRDHEED